MLPAHRYRQEEVTAAFRRSAGTDDPRVGAVLTRLHANAGVQTRHFVLELHRYTELGGFGEANDLFIEHAVDLGAQALRTELDRHGLRPGDLDLLATATVTGLAVPSLDARLAARLGLRPDLRRMPFVGLGCVAGAAGIARIHDYLLGHPGHVAALVCVELCSLTVQYDDLSMANLVASGLFGDGAACVVMVGENVVVGPAAPRAGDEGGMTPSASAAVEVVDVRSRLYADTERAMGFDVSGSGLRIVLGAEVPELVRDNLRADVDTFLADHALTRSDIGWWVAHPGGPKVLEAMQIALDVDAHDLAMTWRSLAAIGNLSSASVLHVLADTLDRRPPAPGSRGMLLAMGPGFCLEMVLLDAVAPT